jgi:hypothetical protein
VIGPNDRSRFEAHAAPEAIAAERARAARYLDRAQRYLLWLDTLANRRSQQVESGAWPKRSAL